MSFQRFSFIRASVLTARSIDALRMSVAAILLLTGLTVAFPSSAAAQTRIFGAPRVANERRERKAFDAVPTGIPSRIDSTGASVPRRDVGESGSVRVESPNAAAVKNDAAVRDAAINNENGKNRSDAAGDVSAVDAAAQAESPWIRQTFGAPEPSKRSGAALRVALRPSLEDARRDPTPANGYLAIVPRANFLKKEKTDEERGGGGGIDARLATNANDAENEKTMAPGLASDRAVVVFELTDLPPDEVRLLRDAEDGRWDEIDLFGAALIAEGLTTRERRAPYREKYERCVAELAKTLARTNDPLKKTEAIYTYLHKKLLTAQYNLNCSSLVASLDSGVFNCVSATTLFNCFAERAGLTVAALETTGHAKSRVKFGDSFLDLETTCSSWERLPDKLRPYSRSVAVARPIRPSSGLDSSIGATTAAVDASFSNASTGAASGSLAASAEPGSTVFDPKTFEESGAPVGYSYTKNRRPMREIGEVELVATIYYNVGVDYYQNERYEEATTAYIKAARLAPNNSTILGNLKATLNNWAIQIAMKEKDFERAIQITEQGMLLDPEFAEYKMNLPIFFQHWTTYLGKDDRWDEVARVEKEYRKRFPQTTQPQTTQPQTTRTR